MKITDIEDNSLFTELTDEEAANIAGGFGFPSWGDLWDSLKSYGTAVAQPFIRMAEDAFYDPFHFLDHLGQRNYPEDNN